MVEENEGSAVESSVQVAKQIKTLLVELPEDRADAARLDELRRVFGKLTAQGDFVVSSSSVDATSARAKWQAFLRSSHKKMIEQLKRRIVKGKRTAIRTLWGVVASTPQTSENGQYQLIHVPLLVHWVQAMAAVPIWDQSIHHMVQAEFLQPFRDVQYYTMIAVQNVADEHYRRKKSTQQTSLAAERLLQILMLIPLATSQKDLDANSKAFLFPAPENAEPGQEQIADHDSDDGSDDDNSVDPDDSSDEEDEDEEPQAKRRKGSRPRFLFEQRNAHARQWSKAWLAVLRLDLPIHALKQALQFLPTNVLPYVGNPLLFADFFVQAYEHTGVVPILALDGLFSLVTEHGLEYPEYYKQLYQLVTPTLFYVRYRTRFFRLLDRSISRNELLPAQTVAAFIKRLLRASLQAPPAGILTALAMASNWIRKHPETAVLVHAADSNPKADVYNATTEDPAASRALQSSLWELHALSQHYLPAVVTLAAAVGSPEQEKAPMFDLEDFYAQSYHNLLEQERKRQRKTKKTPLTFRPPEAGLFGPDDVFAGLLDVPKMAESKENAEQ